MTIKLNMTPFTSIDLRPVIVAFLKNKHRRCKNCKKKRILPWFFEESERNAFTNVE